MLFIDLLAIHMVRDVETSTIISYHRESTWCHIRKAPPLAHAARWVYWQNIFSNTEDPTFLVLAILWYALHSWDESFGFLYNHVNKLVCNLLVLNKNIVPQGYSGVGCTARWSHDDHRPACFLV